MPIKSVHIVIPGTPTAWARASGGKTRKHFTPAKQRAYIQEVKLRARREMGPAEPLSGPISLKIVATYPTPKAGKPGWKITRPDGDNIQKLQQDALNGIVWNDDAQICHYEFFKYYGPEPKLELTAKEI